eukprot:TRINITY_DN1514_c0_g2_i2.p1 TRINITY_DN1514_c0_g2~~TRINITY_DN1514_c0_g2_i2.p1  ORF type:complete len:210 (+),score=91.22 TRINITY_DN1514_c0_g2_i2:81-710(+)
MGNDQSKGMSQEEMMKLQFNLKFTAKQMAKSAAKAEKEQEAEKRKVKAALEKGNVDGARIYAQNAIRKKSESLNYLRLSARLDAVHGRVDQAVKTQQMVRSMGVVTKGMDKVLGSMDMAKIGSVMDQFEKQFEDLDVTAEYMDSAIGGATALTTPEDQVVDLMAQVADENGLELAGKLDGAGAVRVADPAQQQMEKDLAKRIEALQAGK